MEVRTSLIVVRQGLILLQDGILWYVLNNDHPFFYICSTIIVLLFDMLWYLFNNFLILVIAVINRQNKFIIDFFLTKQFVIIIIFFVYILLIIYYFFNFFFPLDWLGQYRLHILRINLQFSRAVQWNGRICVRHTIPRQCTDIHNNR